MKYTKKFYIDAIMFYFGSIKVDAERYYNLCIKEHNYAQLDYIALFYTTQSRQAFYAD